MNSPSAADRALGSSWGKALDLVAGGWAISGMATAQTGYPIVPGLAAANLLEGAQRPNLIGNPSVSGPVRAKLDNYFNVSAFGTPAPDTYGSAPRTLNYRSPGIFNADLTLGKKFRVREGHAVEFRLEGFQCLQQRRIRHPAANFGGTTFGQINNYAGGMGPRELQIALRYDF